MISEFWLPYRTTPITNREIDFDLETLFAVVDVVKGHYLHSIRVSGISRVGRGLVVDVVLRLWGGHCLLPQLNSQSFHIVIMGVLNLVPPVRPSQDRVILGLGVGGMREDFALFGHDFHSRSSPPASAR